MKSGPVESLIFMKEPSDSDHSISSIFDWAATELLEIWPIFIENIVFRKEEVATLKALTPTLYLYFDKISDDTTLFDSQMKKEANVERISEPRQTVEKFEGPICRTVLRLKQGENQDNVPELLQFVSKYVKDVSLDEVLDITFENETDRDVVHHPQFTIYTLGKSK